MDPEISRKLVDLNHQFYQSFAREFSETRERPQVGVMNILERIPETCSILDLGCGNGNTVLQLAENGFQGSYLGADFSLGLLNQAAKAIPLEIQVEFKELDLTAPDWKAVLLEKRFDVICCFATLHHIPGQQMRANLCRNMRRHIKDNGVVYLSAWQFIKSERLKKRILPWDTVGIQADRVDEGDYLLDWRRGGFGIRYVHLYNPVELIELASECGFSVVESFDSDGEGGNLGHYQVWEPF